MVQECELCGRKSDVAYLVSVEEVELRVCARCAKGKHVISEITEKKILKPSQAKRAPVAGEEEIVEGYGERIRIAREHMRIPMKVLAEMLNEKETLLLRVEQQKTLPPEGLRKKLEKTLGIKLQEAASTEGREVRLGNRGEGATIGEFT